MISRAQLLAIMPHAIKRADIFLVPLNDAMDEFAIDTPRRQQAFLAQIAHESAELRYTAEIASGQAYEGRRDLGNLQRGDGQKYKGRGLIQITGRDNYRDCSIALFAGPMVLLEHPELLEAPVAACRSAAWWWSHHGLNTLADNLNSFQAITRRINGGLNGYADRVAYFTTAKTVIV